MLYANRASGATTGAWPGFQTFCGWKGSGTSGKGGLGSWYVPQFMREQSHTVVRLAVNKLYDSPRAALDGLLRDGMTIMSGGFGLVGNPESLIPEIMASGVKDLTVISNNAGADGFGLWHLLTIAPDPQDDLVLRRREQAVRASNICPASSSSSSIRKARSPSASARAAPAFRPSSRVPASGPIVADGKPHEEFEGQTYVRETWLRADLAIIKAWRADPAAISSSARPRATSIRSWRPRRR